MILQRPDERTLLALRRLRSDPDFVEFTAWLQSSLGEIDAKSRVITGTAELHQHQGKAQALAEIVQYCQNGVVPAIARRETRPG